MRRKGIGCLFGSLRERFPLDAALSTKRFADTYLSLKDIAYDDTALERHIFKKLRYVRGMGILE